MSQYHGALKRQPRRRRQPKADGETIVDYIRRVGGATTLGLANKFHWSTQRMARELHAMRDEGLVDYDGERRSSDKLWRTL